MENGQCYLVKLGNGFIAAKPSVEYGNERRVGTAGGARSGRLPALSDFKDVKEEMIFKPINERDFEISKQAAVCTEKGATEQNAF